MFRVSNGTQAAELPTPAAVTGTPGFFQEGNPGITPATIVDEDWANMVQEELYALVVAAGLTPSKTNNEQVLAALQALFSAVAGNASEQFNVAPGSSANNAVNFGQFASVLTGSGYQKLPSGLIIQWGNNAVGTGTNVTFPIAFPHACLQVMAGEEAANGTSWGSGFPSIHGAQSPTANGYTAWAEGWTGSRWVGGSFSQSYIAIGY